MERILNRTVIGLFILLINSSQVLSAENILRQREVVLAYTYNFAKFIDWSSVISSKHINLCFYGKVTNAVLFDSLNGKPVDKKQLLVSTLKRGEDFDYCNILFIETSESIYIDPILDRTKTLPILTVSMINGFTRLGGGIELFEENNKISFNINRNTLNNAGLKMSSQIYLLAHKVVD